MSTFDSAIIRGDFPLLKQNTRGKPLAYLDNGATTQKPHSVIEKLQYYYSHDNANVHRGTYELSERATAAYENTREKVRALINAKNSHEIIFTRGTTEAINLVAFSFGLLKVGLGDEILISGMEHHSNIVPWQMLCERQGATLTVIPVEADGSLNIEKFRALLSPRTKLVALIHVSNVLGTINPVKEMIRVAHAVNVPVLLDGAQAIAHMSVDVQDLDCDFYAFSSHKLYGPTGIGVLYGKDQWLNAMPPFQGGGDMISRVSFKKTEYNVLPYKFEAGTPNIAGVVGLGAAIDYIQQIGFDRIGSHERALTAYATDALKSISGLTIIGNAPEKIGVISFVMQQAHPHDIGTILDREGVSIRAGHHCAMPLMERFGLPATARVSLGIYNTEADIDQLVTGLNKVVEIFGQ